MSSSSGNGRWQLNDYERRRSHHKVNHGRCDASTPSRRQPSAGFHVRYLYRLAEKRRGDDHVPAPLLRGVYHKGASQVQHGVPHLPDEDKDRGANCVETIAWTF
ncbi:hypothetical protein MRX96_004600 [Rhipicephalus microplus]